MKTHKNILSILPALALITVASVALAAPAPPPATPKAGDATPKAGDKAPKAGDATPKAGDKPPKAGDATPKAGDATPKAGDARPGATPAKPTPPPKPACPTCDVKKLCDAKRICDPLKVCDPKTLKHPALICFKKDKKKKKKVLADGWHPKLSLGATLSMIHSHNVPGIDDGVSLTLGGMVNGSLLYKKQQHVWLSSLSLVHAWSKTPTIKPMLKTADELSIKTEYLYNFKKVKKLTFVTGLQFVSPIAAGDLVTAKDTPLTLNLVDGTQQTAFAEANVRYRMTDAFSPIIFKQLSGFNVRPYQTLLTTLDVRLSLAGQEIWAEGYVVSDDKVTPELELKQLQDFQQVGFQFEVVLDGQLNKRVAYAFRAELMFPLYTSVDTELKGFDLLNTDLSFKVGVKMSTWASLNYVFSARRMPVLVDQWQIVNNLVLSLTANIL